MIGLFKQKSPGNVGILLIFGLLLKMPLFLFPKPLVTTENDGSLYQFFIHSISNFSGSPFIGSFISFILLYVQALMINYLINEYRMMPRQNYLPAMSFLLMTSLLPEWSYLSAPLVTNTLVILIFIRLFRLYNAYNERTAVFNIGILAGLSSYIYFPSSIFALCIIAGMIILKPFRFNEVLLFMIGGLTLYYFHAVYLFLYDRLSINNFFPHISVKIPFIKSSIWLAVSTLLLTIPFLIGGYYVQTHLRKMLIQVRKNWSIFLVYLLLAFFVPFVNSNESFYTWVLITSPFAVFHACAYYYPIKMGFPMLLFIMTLGYILYQQYGTTNWQ